MTVPKRKKIILTLISVILIFIGGVIYVNNVLLPIQLKQFLSEYVQKRLHRKITIENFNYNPLKGFIVRGLTIYQKDSSEAAFISIKEASLNVLLPPIIKSQKIIIPSVSIVEPIFYISKNEQNQWNFSDLLEQKPSRKTKKAPPQFFIGSLSIKNGRIEYRQKNNFQEIIDDINIKTNLSLSKGVKFILTLTAPQHASSLKIQGDYNILTKTASGVADFNNIFLAKYLSIFEDNIPNFSLHNGWIKSANLHLSFKNDTKELDLTGNADIMDTDMTIQSTKKLTGQIKASQFTLHKDNNGFQVDSHITLSNGTYQIYNKTFAGKLLEAPKVHFALNGNKRKLLTDFSIHDADFKLTDQRNLKGHIEVKNFELNSEGKNVYMQGDFQVNEADFLMDKEKTLLGGASSTGTRIIVKDKVVHVSSNVKFDNATLTVNDTIFEDSPEANIKFDYNPNSVSQHTYVGWLKFNQGILKRKDLPLMVNSVSGIVNFETNKLKTDSLQFLTDDSLIIASGSVENFYRPALDVRISSNNFNLKLLPQIFSKTFSRTQIIPSGYAIIEGTYKGELGSLKTGQLNISAQLTDAALTAQQLSSPLTHINGQLRWLPQKLFWENVRGIYNDEEYLLNGYINFFPNPFIETSLVSKNIDIATQIKISATTYNILSFTGKYLNNPIDINGYVYLSENDAPLWNLNTVSTLNLEYLKNIASLKEKIKNMNPSGLLHITGHFKGHFNKWREWFVNMRADTPEISLYGLTFNNLILNLKQKNQNIESFDMTAGLSGGSFTTHMTSDFSKENMLFQLTSNIQNADLSLLKQNTAWNKKRLAGKLASAMSAYGYLNDLNSVEGEGFLSITEGHLWELNLLQGILKSLLIPEFENIVFTDAKADLKIKGGRLLTENLELKSNPLTLSAKGWIDFSSNINFNVVPKFSEISILKSESFRKGPTSFLTSEGYLSLKITGTLSKPKYSVDTLPLKIIEKTTDMLKEGVEGILQEIF